jgi:hypothetical protein
MRFPSLKIRRLPPDFWLYMAQVFVGLFFVSSALFKFSSFFLVGDQSLRSHFQFWIGNGWPPGWYKTVLLWMFSLPYGEKVMEALTILLQGVPGLMLIVNWRVRWAAVALLYIQLLIFLGTFHHRGFNEFVGYSIWLSLYYLVRPHNPEEWRGRLGSIFTFLLFVLTALYLYNRYYIDDPWLGAVKWQREHLMHDIMTPFLAWKQFVLIMSHGTIGAYLWASVWWIELLLCGLLLVPNRVRLYAGTGLLLFAIARSWTWMNSVTSQGVLTALVFVVWVVQEEYARRFAAKPPESELILKGAL